MATQLELLTQIARHCWRGAHWEHVQGNHPSHVKEPLKFIHLERHLTPEGPFVGLAGITPGESTTRIAVLDFDSHKGEVPWEQMFTLASNVEELMRTQGHAPHMFRSSGGSGIHIICLWDEPQDAYSVRTNLATTLAHVGMKPGTKGVAKGEVEIFPKQDSVELDGVGSMFILPFARKSEYLGGELPAAWDVSAPVPVLEKPEVVAPEFDAETAPVQLHELRAALAAIPNEGADALDYDTWRNVIFGIHHATGGSAEGLALAHEFSSRSAKYDPEFLDSRVWPYVRSDRGGTLVTERTLFNLAFKHGYVEDVSIQFEDLDRGGDHAQQVAAPSMGAGESVLRPGEPLAGEAGVQPPGSSPKPAPASSRFKVLSLSQFAGLPPVSWLVRGVLPRAPVCAIIGQPGAGKSFIAIDLAFAVARGVYWRDRRVTQGRCAYVAAEDAYGVNLRVMAYCEFHGVNHEELPFGVVPDAPNLLKKEDAVDLIKALRDFGKVDLVVVDTLAQSMPGGDENSSEDMGRVLGHCKAIHQHTGATVLLVHHVGKDAERGARGWSGLFGAVDAELTVERGQGDGREVRVSKMKNGVDGAVLPFRLNVVDLGEDGEGERIDSCIVSHQDGVVRTAAKREPHGAVQKTVWLTLNDLALLGDARVPLGALIEQAAAKLPYDPAKRDKRREHVTRAIQALQEDGFVAVDAGDVRIAGAE